MIILPIAILLLAILLLWLVAKYVPYGVKIVAVIMCLWLLRFFSFIWFEGD